ncbi:unnamed protein product [Dicrocoelium dendriticum]|nr:unnamed protein product [Dicrocoelium dendriticum]
MITLSCFSCCEFSRKEHSGLTAGMIYVHILKRTKADEIISKLISSALYCSGLDPYPTACQLTTCSHCQFDGHCAESLPKLRSSGSLISTNKCT